jgi:hypothetical protein
MGELTAGSVFAGHRIEGVAGRGGMGVVYRATQLTLDRMVALKVIAPGLIEDDATRRRFVRESKIAASIDHPNVIPLVALVASPLGRALSGSVVTLDGARDNWFGPWPPADLTQGGDVPTEERASGGGSAAARR